MAGSGLGASTGASPFAQTHSLFIALIQVEITAQHVYQQLDSCNRMFGDPKLLPNGLWFTATPREDDSDEIRRLKNERRAEQPDHFRAYWKLLDQYHLVERQWRKATDAAKVAADMASTEIDRPGTAPLERTTTQIKKALQNLGGSVPAPLWFGDWPPLGDQRLKDLKTAIDAVSVWIDDLRLVLSPTTPPPDFEKAAKPQDHPASTSHPASTDARSPSLVPLDYTLLAGLRDRGVNTAALGWNAKTMSERIAGAGSYDYVKDRCTVLGTLNFLGKEGNARGAKRFITPEGLAALESHERETASARPNSGKIG